MKVDKSVVNEKHVLKESSLVSLITFYFKTMFEALKLV